MNYPIEMSRQVQQDFTRLDRHPSNTRSVAPWPCSRHVGTASLRKRRVQSMKHRLCTHSMHTAALTKAS